MLELHGELKGIHSTFHISNLKKCLAEGDIVVSMDEIQLDDKLHMIEEPVEVVDREKCLTEGNVVIPLDEIHLDDKFHMIKEPVEEIDREVKRLRQSRIPIVKVRWNSQRGPEYTWERED
nr:hypothetical protein [Tanacetum cinerariifolium]